MLCQYVSLRRFIITEGCCGCPVSLSHTIPITPTKSCKYLPAQTMRFSIRDFFSKCDQIGSFSADLVAFIEEVFNGKLHFFV